VGLGLCDGLASGAGVAELASGIAMATRASSAIANRDVTSGVEIRASPPAAKEPIVMPTTERVARMDQSFVAMG
jgi:hypothetical protein